MSAARSSSRRLQWGAVDPETTRAAAPRGRSGSTGARPPRARAGVAALLVGLVGLVALGGCAEDPSALDQVRVVGEPGEAPTLEYPQPLAVSAPDATLVWEGDGPELTEGRAVLVDYYAEQASDGALVVETHSSEPRPFLLTAEDLGPDIYEALRGRTVGSRVLHVVPADATADSPTVTVFDILPTRAQGEAVQPRDGLPVVTLADDGAPRMTIPEGVEPPADLVVQPLIRGTGPQVAPGQVILVQFTGVTWSDGEVFDTSWAPGEVPVAFPIGVGSVVAGWDQGLVEQPVGSQVLLVVPPSRGYGGTGTELADETLVFVVDILAARGGPAPQ